MLCVGIFANGKYGAGWNLAVDDAGEPKKIEGLIKGEFGQFGAQLLGALVILTVILGIAYAFFKIQDKMTKGGIRPPEEEEIAGVDMAEMGVVAYVD